MRREYFVRYVLSVVLIGVLLLSGIPIAGRSIAAAYQGQNLLQNPGFEEPFLTVGADPALHVASGWQPWHLPTPPGESSAINARPEYKPAPPNRVRSGGAAQEYNTFFATHTAGVYQRVPVTPGTDLRFSVFMYIWSSETFANPDVSDEPNTVIVNVGIDPSGGTDPTSPNILWSDDAEFYDEYRELSVTATSEGTAVTVFVRSAPKGFVGVNNIYLDDAALVPLGTAPLPQDTLEPTAIPTRDVFVPTQEGTITPVPTTLVPPPTFTPNVPTRIPPTVTPSPTVPPVPTATPDLPDEFTGSILYTVVAGDTVWEIARRFGSAMNAIIEVNDLPGSGLIVVGQVLVIPVRDGQPVPPTLTPVPAQPTIEGGGGASLPTYGTYTVVRGDTLSRIASRFNTTVAVLSQLNNIVNPNLIFPGQQLRVPGAPQPVPAQPTPVPPQQAPPPPRPNTHVVQPGENLFRIALKYNVSWDYLARYNGIYNANYIFAGQVLTIPPR